MTFKKRHQLHRRAPQGLGLDQLQGTANVSVNDDD